MSQDRQELQVRPAIYLSEAFQFASFSPPYNETSCELKAFSSAFLYYPIPRLHWPSYMKHTHDVPMQRCRLHILLL